MLISGKQGSGKTTLYEALFEAIKSRQGGHWIPYGIIFAGPLYKMHDFCRGILVDAGVDPIHKVKDGNLLQLLGTEWGRNTIDKDVWVKIVDGQIKQMGEALRHNNPESTQKFVFLISDGRFENEFDFFTRALRVRLECPEEVRKSRAQKSTMWRDNTNHPSEVGLDKYADEGRFDLVFHTDDPINTPEHMTQLIMAKILKNNWQEKRKSFGVTKLSNKIPLECCVCGHYAGKWEQHYNRDNGYGICEGCAVEEMKSNNAVEYHQKCYGKLGVNWGPSDPDRAKLYDRTEDRSRDISAHVAESFRKYL